jgi:uracil-DNA glycosylase
LLAISEETMSELMHPGWWDALHQEFESPHWLKLQAFLRDRRAHSTIQPDRENIFRAFKYVSIHDIRVVIVGQDPYPTPGQPTGLAFGIRRGTNMPRTLVNICDEVDRCLVAEESPYALDRTNLTLEGWARQGVLLLNTVLTTEPGKIAAHQNQGWEWFTDQVLRILAERNKSRMVFMLWGRAAQEKQQMLRDYFGGPRDNIMYLTATHPSPLSFRKGPLSEQFRGCGHFAKANAEFRKWNLPTINWAAAGS